MYSPLGHTLNDIKILLECFYHKYRIDQTVKPYDIMMARLEKRQTSQDENCFGIHPGFKH